jgi:hypothetical protein
LNESGDIRPGKTARKLNKKAEIQIIAAGSHKLDFGYDGGLISGFS